MIMDVPVDHAIVSNVNKIKHYKFFTVAFFEIFDIIVTV